ncbi:androglobin-like [Tubulanus polymorphus]|uniref:androglobin-like n=1 Tax=Tubulanus polymorphus TaxID=672921 RepID=UPI003DA4A402
MASKPAKKTPSTARVGSASNKEAASIAASIGGSQEGKRHKYVIWPEWNDADINAEKWDVAHKGKEKDKGKSPVVQQHFFDDPEGKVILPSTLKPTQWKRPQDFILDKMPTIVDADRLYSFDLITANEHIQESELMRWITSQFDALWNACTVKNAPADHPDIAPNGYLYTWRPWEHIYAINKVGKGPNIPVYNPSGKYVVKLYWMGVWRKIIVDDNLPFDETDRLLLPATSLKHELWPMLLTKALLKVAALDYSGGSQCCEFGDFSIIQCLTGWLPEVIPLQYGHMEEIWDLLKTSLDEWKLPETEPLNSPENTEDTTLENKDCERTDTREKLEKEKTKDGKKEEKGKDKGKDGKDKKDKDKDKHKEKSNIGEETVLPESPEMVVFASYNSLPKYPVRVSLLAEMADASERLRQMGLSHMYPHPVWITQTRSCPLEPPPPPEVIPNWKTIRPRIKKPLPTDEPKEEEIEKRIQCLHVTSPFLNYKVSPVPIPVHTHRPKSALERGGSRQGSTGVAAIEETDESIPETPVEPPSEQIEQEAPRVEITITPAAIETNPVIPNNNNNIITDKKTTKDGGKKQRDKSPSTSRRPSSIMSEHTTTTAKSASKKPSKDLDKSKDRTASATKKISTAERTEKESKQGSAPSMSDGIEGSELGETPRSDKTIEDSSPTAASADITPDDKTNKQIWVDFDVFCKCFKTLIVYHKPNTYPTNQKHTDMKSNVMSGGSTAGSGAGTGGGGGSKSEKKSAPTTAVASYEDRSPLYLFADNLKPTEIVVSFSCLSRWNEPPTLASGKESHISLRGKEKSDVEKEPSNLGSVAGDDDSHSQKDGSGNIDSLLQPLQPGTLVAEPHSWKSVVTGQPILRLRTTGTKVAVMTLPAGRHVLKINMTSPLGHHVHLCSSVPFVFGDEETVMPHLTKESCRFIDSATQLISAIGKVIQTFHETEGFKQSWDELIQLHCPHRNIKTISKVQHFELFNHSLYEMLKKGLTEILNPEMAFAWRVFNYDAITPNPLGLTFGSSRPENPPPAATGGTSHRGSANKPGKKPSQAAQQNQQQEQVKSTDQEKVETWVNREPTPEEHVASVKIQRLWRGYYVRKIRSSRTPGTEDNLKVQETLLKAWAVLEQQSDQNGLALFRTMFKSDGELMSRYSFHKDEWNKISYADYSGVHPEQPAHTWFIVFREVFFVSEDMLAVPKLYVSIPTCLLRVINNDTGEEIPRVFQKVAPYVYKKNKLGYTFVAEARTTDLPLPTGKWRMRLIGSLSPLPAPVKNEVNASFNMRELRDYYIPNKHMIIHRYSVKVIEDHLTSLQVTISKPDVYVKLQVLDNEQELMSATGKGHVVIPSFIFHKDIQPEEKRSSSRTSNRGVVSRSQSRNRNVNSARSNREDSAVCSHHSDVDDSEEDKPHKYIIQALVLRNSWPLSENQWTFVQQLMELEKNELKLNRPEKERAPSPSKETKSSPAAKGKGKDKGKGGKDKDKGQSSRPPSQQFDFLKPHYVLRVVSDGTNTEDIEVKKDTERADEIRAMKKAWEDAEPGRAAKALQSRLNYLNSHMISLVPDTDEDEKKEESELEESEMLDTVPSQTPVTPVEGVDSDTILTTEPPQPPAPKQILQPLDLTPFERGLFGEKRYLDDELIAEQMQKKQQEIQRFKQLREEVEEWRENDRKHRNWLKIHQLEMCEELQANLDKKRAEFNEPREVFRQKYLAAERLRLEQLAAQEAELDKAPTPKGKKGSAKGKKGSAKGKKK